ncbi:MAG: hypothetical protein QNJ55_11670 [Xenococcus sp. MO_188.B8]|nr:hypothetical protein [Xenococcus sp. MO_188.B8]
MDTNQTKKTSSFQNAIAVVEALSTEEQTLLIQIIQERLQQKQNNQVASDIKNTKGFQAYLASKQKRFEVYKNLADS